jgi:hypothetical protein
MSRPFRAAHETSARVCEGGNSECVELRTSGTRMELPRFKHRAVLAALSDMVPHFVVLMCERRCCEGSHVGTLVEFTCLGKSHINEGCGVYERQW